MNDHARQIAQEFAELLRARLGDRVKQIILFGSQARGDAREGSDYDVLVIVDERTPEVEDAILDTDVEMMNKHEALFGSLVYNDSEWEEAQVYPLAWNVKSEGVSL